MTQKEKKLLLKDLCARSFYGVMCDRLGQAKKLLSVSPDKLYCIELDNGEYTPSKYKVEDVKPYLRPMSSMTEEEREKLCEICTLYTNDGDASTYEYWGIEIVHSSRYGIVFENNYSAIDWLNEHHFDYRGLIPMGLALEAPEGMYK